MLRTFAMLAVAGVVALLAGTWFATWWRMSGDPLAACLERGVIRGSDAFGGPFGLTGSDGRTWTQDDVLTGPALIYFGYTFCPDVCPMDLQRNAGAVDRLKALGHDVRPVFITIDPARDTPQEVGAFAAAHGSDVLGLTGTEAQIEAAAGAYLVSFHRGAGEDDTYLMNHTAYTYLHVPGEGVALIFNPAFDVRTGSEGVTEEVVARATQCALDRL